MSSMYPSQRSGPPMLPCQRCGMLLPIIEPLCGNCGFNNAPSQGSGNMPVQRTGGLLSSGIYAPRPATGQLNGTPSLLPPTNPQFGTPFSPSMSQQNPQYPLPNQAGPFNSVQNPMANSSYPFGFPPGANPTANLDNYFVGNRNVALSSVNASVPTLQRPQSWVSPAPTPSGSGEDPPAKRPKRAIGVVLILLVILLVGGGAGGYFYLMNIRQSTTSAQQTYTPTPLPSPQGTPIFHEPFQDNSNGWNLTSQQGKYSAKIQNGSLILEDDENNLLPEILPSTTTFNDFLLTVDVVLSKGTQGNGYGIYIRGNVNQTGDLTTYYRFELYGDGSFTVMKGNVDASGAAQVTKLVPDASSTIINKQGSVNHIRILAKGASMSFIVNGQVLKTFSDTSYAGGLIALFVSNVPGEQPGAEATFSNLAIYSPTA